MTFIFKNVCKKRQKNRLNRICYEIIKIRKAHL